MASDVTKSLSWIKTVREKVEKTDTTTPAPTTTSTQTSTPGQTDPTDEGTTVETDENTTVEGGKTHNKTCHNKISGTMEVTTVTTSLRNGSEKSSPVFAVWMLFAAYLIIVHIVV